MVVDVDAHAVAGVDDDKGVGVDAHSVAGADDIGGRDWWFLSYQCVPDIA